MNAIAKSDTILIRNIELADADQIFGYRSLPEVAKYQYWQAYTAEDATNYVKQCADNEINNEGLWTGLAVVRRENKELIGDCALRINGAVAEVGCNINPKFQRCGYAKEALLLLIDLCSKELGIDELFGITDSENSASIRLMKSVGMVKDATFEEKVMCKGTWSIEHKYVIKLD